MAEYTNDLRLKEIGTGESSGTWGTETNTNLELIAEAFSYGTEASFGSDADATTTIADGATDPARSLYLKITSGVSLTATRTLTIAPNTVSKVWIIENATSGSQSINISQGSGANVTISNGDVKVVYSDGAGSGAAVVDAFASLSVGDLTATNLAGTLTTAAQPNITSVGTLTGLDVAGTPTFDGLTVDGDASISSANARLRLFETDTTDLNTQFQNQAGDFFIKTIPDDASSSTSRFGIDHSTGDISFYEDTGTTAKFFWDASAESLGIGTDSPSDTLDIERATGVVSLGLQSRDSSDTKINFGDNNDGNVGIINYAHSDNSMRFTTNASANANMTLDSSGRLLIGHQTAKGYALDVDKANIGVASFNRTGTDGEVVSIRKDGSPVGSISTINSTLVIGSGDTGLLFSSGDDVIIPRNSSTAVRDAAIDLGDSGSRFKDLYLSGGAYLGGTGSANYLDDYEEGTWTASSGTTGITFYGNTTGTYTKIGRIVYFTMSFKCNKTGSGSTQVAVSGLPFSGSGGMLQFTRFEPTGIAYQWINGAVGGTTVYFTRPAGTAPGSSGGTNNNDGQVLEIDDISTTTNSALQNVSAYGWYST